MDSFDSNDWTNDPYGGAPTGTPGQAAYSGAVTSRPAGSDLPLEQIQIRRDDQPVDATSGAITEAFEYVKQYPGQTIVMSLLSLMFSGGGFNFPGGGGNDFGSSGGYDDSYDSYDSYDSTGGGGGSDYNYGSWFDGSDIMSVIGPDALFSGSSPIVGAMGGGEIAVIAAIAFVVIAFSIVMFLVGAFVRIGASSMWLRILRGQDSSFGAAFKGAGSFFLPMAGTLFLTALAVFGGTLLCLIPGIILTLGLYFVHFMVVDKNIGYVDAIKASWQLTDGHKVSLLIFVILAWLLNVGGILACCVGIIGTNAITMGAMAIIYNRLAAPGNAYLQEGEGVTNVFE